MEFRPETKEYRSAAGGFCRLVICVICCSLPAFAEEDVAAQKRAASMSRVGSAYSASVGIVYCAEGAVSLPKNATAGVAMIGHCKQQLATASEMKENELKALRNANAPAPYIGLRVNRAIMESPEAKAVFSDFEKEYSTSRNSLIERMAASSGLGGFSDILKTKFPSDSVNKTIAGAAPTPEGLAGSRLRNFGPGYLDGKYWSDGVAAVADAEERARARNLDLGSLDWGEVKKLLKSGVPEPESAAERQLASVMDTPMGNLPQVELQPVAPTDPIEGAVALNAVGVARSVQADAYKQGASMFGIQGDATAVFANLPKENDTIFEIVHRKYTEKQRSLGVKGAP